MTFYQKLKAIVNKNNSLLCIGLDSNFEKLPKFIKVKKHPQFEFNKAIIEATHQLVCAYKPNIAFYEAQGLEGLRDLKLTFDYLRENHPEIITILDAKIADIGNTNRQYEKFVFEFLGADAVTINPYLGKEALKTFLEKKDKGFFILCRTSNPGAGEFQDLKVVSNTCKTHPRFKKEKKGDFEKKPVYQIVAENVVKKWNFNNNCGLVVGATYPEELKIVRHIVGDLPLLIPGIGVQGADVEETIRSGIDSKGQNTIINLSRSIIFAGKDRDFSERARAEASKFKELINQFKDNSFTGDTFDL